MSKPPQPSRTWFRPTALALGLAVALASGVLATSCDGCDDTTGSNPDPLPSCGELVCETDAGPVYTGDGGNDDPFGDRDSDGALNSDDNCPDDENADQADQDGDGVGDVCDGCPRIANADQADADGNGVADACEGGTSYDPDGDDDGDGKTNTQDNCPLQANPGQQDADLDGLGDVCDICPDAADPDQTDTDGDGVGDACALAPTGMVCGDAMTDFAPIEPNVHVLLDRSGSMAGQKWTDALAAIDALGVAHASQVRLAFSVFRSTLVGDDGAELRLEIGKHTAAELSAAHVGLVPGGTTPTRQALQDVRRGQPQSNGLSNWISDPMDAQNRDRNKALILITDGEPCCDSFNTIDATEIEAERLCVAGIPTYVVGIPPVTELALQRMAVAGCSDNQDPNDGINYYLANNASEIGAAIEEITGSFIACDFVLQAPPPDANKIWVDIGGMFVPREPGHGFEYDPLTRTVTLKGNSCTMLQDADPATTSLGITLGCPTSCAGEEVCDFVDNDCDGEIDEGCEACEPEICDGVDNDCDDEIDEGCPSCIVSGGVCSADGDCCAGTCTDGICKPPCRPLGVSCNDSSECCRGVCGGGICISG